MNPQELITRYQDAVASLDVERLLALYAPDARVFDASSRWQYASRDEWRTGVEEWLSASMQGGSCTLSEVETVEAGGAVVVSGLARYEAEMDGRRDGVTTRLTHVWREVDGEWLIVHEHTSLPLDGSMERPLPQP